MIKIYDRNGIERSWTWLTANYGDLTIRAAAPGRGWHLVEIYESADTVKTLPPRRGEMEGGSTLAAPAIICKVLTADGRPAAGIKVAWYWPDAPEDPDAGPSNGLPAGMYPTRAVSGLTNDNGNVGFAMGRGAYYSPPERGPHACWVYGQNSHVVVGLGMLAGTNHSHLDLVFRESEQEQPGPDPDDEPNWTVLLESIETIILLLTKILERTNPA